MRCLIIEDNPPDSELLKTYIKKSRPAAKITVCDNFIKGAKELYREKYDVIFLDLNLPDNWGISSIKELKKYAQNIPIIVTTSFTSKTTIEEAQKAGAAVIFEKRELSSVAISKLIGKQEMVG